MQLDLFKDSPAELFDAWRQTPGGRHLLRYAYIVTAHLLRGCGAGQRISAKLVFELMRYRLPAIRARLNRRGVQIEQVAGYTLNNSFTAYIARHLMAHRTDWQERFEVREINRK